MQVRSFKLSGNTELLAQLVREEENHYVISRPLVVMPMRGGDGSVQVGFAMWSMLIEEDQEIKLRISSTLCEPLLVSDEVSTSYIEQVTGLSLPPSTSKILHG